MFLIVSFLVGPNGHVHTVEIREDMSSKAQNTIKSWRENSPCVWPTNVCFHNFDVKVVNSVDGIPNKVDMVGIHKISCPARTTFNLHLHLYYYTQ